MTGALDWVRALGRLLFFLFLWPVGLVRWLIAGGRERWVPFGAVPAAVAVVAALLTAVGVPTGPAVVAPMAAALVGLGLYQLGFSWPLLVPVAAVVFASVLGGVLGFTAALVVLATIAAVVRRRSGSWAFLRAIQAAALDKARVSADKDRRYVSRRAATFRKVLSAHVRPEMPFPVKILETSLALAGPVIVFRLPPGVALSDLEKVADRIAGALAVGRVHFELANPLDASVIRARLLELDPLLYPLPVEANPWAAVPQTSGLSPVPLGVDEDGSPVELVLAGGGFAVLIGGSPGSGKSIVQLFAAHGCRDPRRRPYLIDLKGGVELQAWAHLATRFATTLAEAAAALAEVEAEMLRRLDVMRTHGWRDWTESGDPSRVLVLVDEAAQLLQASDPAEKDASRAAEAHLRRLVAMGRAAGIQLVLATQKPTSDAIPTAIRDLMGTRICFRVGTRQQAEAVLGPDALARGADPMSIPVQSPGLGYIVAEDGTLRRFRAWHASDDLVKTLAGRR